jgi:hypothetical protein
MHESMTPQQLGRTETITKDAGWHAAFKDQCTREVLASVARFAKKRAKWIQLKIRRADSLLWQELFNDALEDTWLGEVTWDPHKVRLEIHLKRTIRSRSSTLMDHLMRFPRDWVDDEERDEVDDLALEGAMSSSIEAVRGHVSLTSIDLRAHVADVIARLQALADGDAEVVQILEAFGNGKVERCDVMRATGLSQPAYHNARRRLLRLVGQLPQELRDEAIHAMA